MPHERYYWRVFRTLSYTYIPPQTIDSVSGCHPDGQGSNPRDSIICEAVCGVPSLFVIARLVRALNNNLYLLTSRFEGYYEILYSFFRYLF